MDETCNPDGFTTITPNAIVKSVAKAVEFYAKVFGAKEVLRLKMPDGTVAHCELKIGDSRFNLGEPMEGWPEQPLLAQIHVADSDATFAAAIQAGARELSPIEDTFFGSREGRVLDPFGNTWIISTHKRAVSAEEMQRHLDATQGHGPEGLQAQRALRIEKATAADIPCLVELMERFYQESDHPLDREAAGRSFRQILQDPSLGCVWLARIQQEPVGHAVLTSRFAMEYGGMGGQIDDLYVRPSFRRSGVAMRLLEALTSECRARGFQCVSVEVATSNGPARALYSRFQMAPTVDDLLQLRAPMPQGLPDHRAAETSRSREQANPGSAGESR